MVNYTKSYMSVVIYEILIIITIQHHIMIIKSSSIIIIQMVKWHLLL